MTPLAPDRDAPAILAANATLADRDGVVVCNAVSLSAARGSVYALMGHDSGPAVFLRALRGRAAIESGRITLFGLDARRRWRLRSRLATVRPGSFLPSPRDRRALADLLLIEEGEHWPTEELVALRHRAAAAGTTIFLTTRDPATAEAVADRIGMLSRARLVTDEPVPRILERFRRIRYSNRLTETRTSFGGELDEFDAVRVRVRGWGVEAIVANFKNEVFARFRGVDGVEDARAEVLTLAEVFDALRET